MKTAYLVTSGEYSDYSICAVFDSRELAEAMVADRTGYYIEEYIVNPGEAQYREGQRKFIVEMRADGSVMRVYDLGWAWSVMDTDEARIKAETVWEYQPAFRMIVVGWFLKREVWAKSEEQAIKSTNEVRAQWIADGQWDAGILAARASVTYADFAPGV